MVSDAVGWPNRYLILRSSALCHNGEGIGKMEVGGHREKGARWFRQDHRLQRSGFCLGLLGQGCAMLFWNAFVVRLRR